MGCRYGISLVVVLALGAAGCSSSGNSSPIPSAGSTTATTQSAATSAGPVKCKWSSSLGRWVKVVPSADGNSWVQVSKECIPDPADATGDVGGDTSTDVPRPNRGDSLAVYNVAPPGTTLAAWVRAWDRPALRMRLRMLAVPDPANRLPHRPLPRPRRVRPLLPRPHRI
jgi:hypothetical protein